MAKITQKQCIHESNLQALIFVFCLNMAQFKAISRRNFFDPQKILLKYPRLISILIPNFNRNLSLKIAFIQGY